VGTPATEKIRLPKYKLNYRMINRAVALIYWIFKKDFKQTTPYFSTCLITTLMLFVNFTSLLVILNNTNLMLSFKFIENVKLNSWINTIIQGSILWILFFIIFPKNKLELYQFREDQIIAGRKKLISIIILSITLMSGLLVKSGLNKGLI
jgi:hypothetical protein